MAEKDKTWGLKVNLHDFPKDTLKQIKDISDKHNGSREWLANVYFKDGKYILGSPVLGNYSGVSMKPDEQAIKDRFSTGMRECMEMGHEKGACKNIVSQQSGKGAHYNAKTLGATPEDLVATIHLHPIKAFESSHNKKIRSQFSGTDIGSEFAKAIKDDRQYKMFLAYPEVGNRHQRHNILKSITFPGKQSMAVMKASNPHLSDEQIMSITADGKGINVVDWYAYQDESKKRGLIQEIDIENATGSEAYASYGRYYTGAIVVGVLAVIAAVYIINKMKKKAVK